MFYLVFHPTIHLADRLTGLGNCNKYFTDGWLKQQTCMCPSPGGWKSKSKVLEDQVSGESSLPGLKMSVLASHPHRVDCRDGEQTLEPLLIRALIPSCGSHPPDPSFRHCNTGDSVQHMNSGGWRGGNTNIQSTTQIYHFTSALAS